MNELCDLDEAQLLDYISSLASAELQAAVEHSPACRAAAQQLADDLLPLINVVYRIECPAADMLVAYQERSLGSTEQLVLRQHMQACSLCQREVALLNSIDALPNPQPSLVRRIIEAIFQPALDAAPQLRGGSAVLRYHTPHIAITLSVREGSGKPSIWTLRGAVRSPEGTLLRGLLETAEIMLLDPEDAPAQPGAIDANGTFVFVGLAPGSYRLRLRTPEEEIVIRQIAIADADE